MSRPTPARDLIPTTDPEHLNALVELDRRRDLIDALLKANREGTDEEVRALFEGGC